MHVRETMLGIAGTVMIAAQKAAEHASVVAWVRETADVVIKLGGAAAIVGAVVMWLVRKMLRPAIRREVLRIFEKDIRAFRALVERMECIAEECEIAHESTEQLEEGQAIILEMLEDTREWMTGFSALFDRVIGADRRIHGGRPPPVPERRHDDVARINAPLIERERTMRLDRRARRERLRAISERVQDIAPEIAGVDDDTPPETIT